MPGTFVLKCMYCLFVVTVTVKETLADFNHGYTWSEVKPNTTYRPSMQVDASTWVDNNDWLWLYGGKNISSKSNQLNDLWKFNTNKFKWYRIPKFANTSALPPTNHGLTCYCAGLVFVLGGRSDKAMLSNKFWTYNSSENSWHFANLPESTKDVKNYHALWCNGNIDTVTLLVNPNNTILYLWNYAIKTGEWKSLALNGTESFVEMFSKNTSNYVTSGTNSTKYIYFWPSRLSINKSMLLFINYAKFKIFHIVGEHPGCRVNFVHWSDLGGNLWVVGGQRCNSSYRYSDQWVLHVSTLKWASVDINKSSPTPRTDALVWEVGNLVWLYGGSVRGFNGSMVVLHDLWIGHPSKHAAPFKPDNHLPGDTLGLSMTDKLIISGLVLLVVMMVSVRLCYKRELNQMLSKLRHSRVPYHQLNQEGEKSSRL